MLKKTRVLPHQPYTTDWYDNIMSIDCKTLNDKVRTWEDSSWINGRHGVCYHLSVDPDGVAGMSWEHMNFEL